MLSEIVLRQLGSVVTWSWHIAYFSLYESPLNRSEGLLRFVVRSLILGVSECCQHSLVFPRTRGISSPGYYRIKEPRLLRTKCDLLGIHFDHASLLPLKRALVIVVSARTQFDLYKGIEVLGLVKPFLTWSKELILGRFLHLLERSVQMLLSEVSTWPRNWPLIVLFVFFYLLLGWLLISTQLSDYDTCLISSHTHIVSWCFPKPHQFKLDLHVLIPLFGGRRVHSPSGPFTLRFEYRCILALVGISVCLQQVIATRADSLPWAYFPNHTAVTSVLRVRYCPTSVPLDQKRIVCLVIAWA